MKSDTIAQLQAAVAGRYRVERELGRGGMATVYLVRDLRHDRLVALKLLDPDIGAVLGAERFLREIRVTATLQHPHLVPLFDSGEADGLLYYVMPYVEGESLRARLDRETQLPVDEAVRIAVAIAAALDYAHRQGVIHRDLKPENVLFQAGEPLVADFGIAIALTRSAGERITRTGFSLGTPQYMSPEQAAGDRQIDGRTDIYSLGALLFEMLVGEPPHTGTSAQGIIAKVISEPSPDVRTRRAAVPDHVGSALGRALAVLPADRWTTAGELGTALVHAPIAADAGQTFTSQRFIPASTPSGRRGWWPAVGLVAAACAVAAVALVMLLGGRTARVERRDVTVRFALPLDSTMRLPLAQRAIAFSPDGRTVAFISIAAEGRKLFVRRLDETQTRSPYTGGVQEIFFSPDGTWIGLYTRGGVQKVAVTSGGAPSLVANVGDVYGGAWTGDNHIVLGTGRGLLVVDATRGGAARILTPTDTARGEMSQRWPLLLSDGATIVYASFGASALASDAKLGVASLATGRASILALPGTCPLGLVDDHLVYANAAGTLMAVAFDVRRARVVGEPAPLSEQVPMGPSGCPEAAMSGEGSLAYVSVIAQRELVEVGAGGASRRVLRDPGRLSAPRYAPDGSRIALTIGAAEASDVWIYDIASTTLTRLTAEGRNSNAEWTPDGRAILFTSTRGDGRRAVWEQPADGSGSARLLVKVPLHDVSEVAMARDGRTLVYTVQDPSRDVGFGGGVLWWRRLDGDTGAHRLTASGVDDASPQLSPDGRWLAYSSSESGSFQVYVRPFPGPGPRYQVSAGPRATAPAWSRDGRTVYYQQTDTVFAAAVRTSPTFAVPSRTPLFHGPFQFGPGHAGYDPSPDGRHLLMLRNVGADSITVVHGWAEEVRAKWR